LDETFVGQNLIYLIINNAPSHGVLKAKALALHTTIKIENIMKKYKIGSTEIFIALALTATLMAIFLS